jgi:hypothetical protein
MKHALRFLAIAATIAAATSAHAVSDASNDFLASFTGVHVGALDILSADVSFDPTANNFRLHAHTAGSIAGVTGAAYVFGFNRGGTANSPFGTIGAPGVSFNATATLRSNGTGAVGATAVPTTIAGNDIFGTVSASLLPPNGFAAKDFTWALWSIDSTIAGLPRNADFGPDANIRVAVVPEPETYALMAAGLAMLGVVARRRRVR